MTSEKNMIEVPLLKVGDVCRVFRQPSDTTVRVVGEVGFISEILEEYASITTLRLDGSMAGAESIPISCLKKETDIRWKKAKELRDQQFNQLMEEGLERGRRWQNKLAEVALKNFLTKEQVEVLYSELRDFSEYMR